MDWAAFRNFEQSVFLRFIDIAAQLNLTIDAVQKALFRFTVHAVLGVNPVMLKPYSHAP